MALKGCQASFLIGANTVAELTNVTNTFTGETLDITTFDSSCVREFIQGLKSGSVSITGYYDPTDTNGQVAMMTAFLAGTNIVVPKFLVDGTHGFSGAEGVVSSYAVDATIDGLVGFSSTIQLSGTLAVVS